MESDTFRDILDRAGSGRDGQGKLSAGLAAPRAGNKFAPLPRAM